MALLSDETTTRLRVTREQIARFEEALREEWQEAGPGPYVHPLIYQAGKAALMGQLDDLRADELKLLSRAVREAPSAATMLVKAYIDFALARGRKRLPPGMGEEGAIEPDFDFLHTAFAEFNIERNAGALHLAAEADGDDDENE